MLGVAALAFAVMLGGLLASPHPYGSVDFVVDFFAAELVLAAVLVGAVLAAFPAARLGLGAPRGIEPRRVAPLALLLAAAVGIWLFARASLPDGAADAATLVARAADHRTGGLQRGAAVPRIAAGRVLAVVGRATRCGRGDGRVRRVPPPQPGRGVPPLGAAFQFLFTMLAGAIFIQGAVGARSLWPAMVVHGLYDAATFDLARFAVAGAGHGPALALGGIALVLGLWSLVQLRSLAGAEPYAR